MNKTLIMWRKSIALSCGHNKLVGYFVDKELAQLSDCSVYRFHCCSHIPEMPQSAHAFSDSDDSQQDALGPSSSNFKLNLVLLFFITSRVSRLPNHLRSLSRIRWIKGLLCYWWEWAVQGRQILWSSELHHFERSCNTLTFPRMYATIFFLSWWTFSIYGAINRNSSKDNLILEEKDFLFWNPYSSSRTALRDEQREA